MRFCSSCGARSLSRRPKATIFRDTSARRAGAIHYENPKVVVGALPEWKTGSSLSSRIEPRHGFWTVPAGFMENRETTADAAARETEEEARARIEVGALLYSLVNISHISQVHLFYRARLLDLDFGPGPESLEVRLFSEAEIPWDDIAFRSIHLTLRHFFEDRRRGSFGFIPPILRHRGRGPAPRAADGLPGKPPQANAGQTPIQPRRRRMASLPSRGRRLSRASVNGAFVRNQLEGHEFVATKAWMRIESPGARRSPRRKWNSPSGRPSR